MRMVCGRDDEHLVSVKRADGRFNRLPVLVTKVPVSKCRACDPPHIRTAQ